MNKKKENFNYKIPSEKEYKEILKIREEQKSNVYNFSREQFIIAEKNWKLAWFIRCYKNWDNTELWALYVNEKFRWEKLGYKLISYIIENFDPKEFYMDCKKSLENYYLKFWFEILEKPMNFQMQKIKDINKQYWIKQTEEEILEKTLFMKFIKNNNN